jgi:hypothetical protein
MSIEAFGLMAVAARHALVDTLAAASRVAK